MRVLLASLGLLAAAPAAAHADPLDDLRWLEAIDFRYARIDCAGAGGR